MGYWITLRQEEAGSKGRGPHFNLLRLLWVGDPMATTLRPISIRVKDSCGYR
jgi:hypothetical protein